MLEVKELKKINGGINITAGILIGGFITFLIGVFDGYVRPYACR
jgi:hypothetical protein